MDSLSRLTQKLSSYPMMDLDYIESELEIEIPNVYRVFLQQAYETGIDLESLEFFADEERLVEFNEMMAEDFHQWKPHFIAFGPGDGCGNWFVIDATSVDTDNVLLVAHDPVGVELVGAASEFFANYLKHAR